MSIFLLYLSAKVFLHPRRTFLIYSNEHEDVPVGLEDQVLLPIGFT
jgi:hypothetical protein